MQLAAQAHDVPRTPPARSSPAPIERRPPSAAPSNGTLIGPHRAGQAGQPGQHLSQWMQSHSNLPLAQQQSALEAEPGFRQLQPQVQQRMHDRLTQLNNMQPEQRQRVIARTEAMERLAPPQRQQVRSAMQQLGSLPEGRRRAVARTFHYLNAMPDAQRQSYMNSPQYRGQFNDGERATMNNLLTVAPMLPPAPSTRAPMQPGQPGPPR